MNPLDFLNQFLGLSQSNNENPEFDRWQRIKSELYQSPAVSDGVGMGGDTPEWVDKVAAVRASDKYQNWLKTSQEFDLGGKRFKWVEADSPYGQRHDIANNSPEDIAKQCQKCIQKTRGNTKGLIKILSMNVS